MEHRVIEAERIASPGTSDCLKTDNTINIRPV